MSKPKTTPRGRVSFPSLFEPNDYNDPPKYEVTLLFPPDADLSELKAAANDAAFEKWGDKAKSMKGLRSPFRDCSEKPDIGGYEDGWTFIAFRSKNPIAIVDQARRPITEDSGKVYPGCWGIVAYSAYAYEAKGNSGVAFGLQAFQKAGDDDSFASAVDPNDAFEVIEGGEEAPSFLD